MRVLASPLLGRIDFGFGPPPNLSANPRNLALITAIYPASYSWNLLTPSSIVGRRLERAWRWGRSRERKRFSSMFDESR